VGPVLRFRGIASGFTPWNFSKGIPERDAFRLFSRSAARPVAGNFKTPKICRSFSYRFPDYLYLPALLSSPYVRYVKKMDKIASGSFNVDLM